MSLPIGFASQQSLGTRSPQRRPASRSSTPSKAPSSKLSQLRQSTLRLSQFLTPRSPTPRSQQTKSRPKHIPIVIPSHACPVLPNSPSISPSDGQKSDYDPSLSDFPLPSSVTQPLAAPRLRYVEIKIPDWVAAKYLPSTPNSLDFPISPADSGPLGRKEAASDVSFEESGEEVTLREFLEEETERKDSAVSFGTMAHPMKLTTRANPMATGVPTTAAQPYGSNPSGSSQLYRINTHDSTPDVTQMRTPVMNLQPQSAGPSPAANPSPAAAQQTPGGTTQPSSSNMGLSGFVCNVHRTTGREPKPLVGATTTIVGDKLYVFAGRRISKSRTQLTSELYELDLLQRHWTKLECKGEIPPPRYFHSVCALGDTKLVCYGGMSPSSMPNGKPAPPPAQQGTLPDANEMGVMSDVHIYDIPTKTWTRINAINPPQGRYAHCATILPSSTVFSQPRATPGVLKQNPQSQGAPNQGTLGVSRDGAGGAEMIVVGGQDSANHYIEQISVFNLRSQTWTSTNPLGRSCGAYRSVTAPLSASVASQIGIGGPDAVNETDKNDKPPDGGSAMLIYSNYNFLDVKLELQIHLHDGTLVEKHMSEGYSPPGLRFPNGGVINGHFVVSGTFLTSYKQEYALWALDLRSLTWSRIDIGSSTFSQGSWNRGILWSRRNSFVILGNRKRSLVEDYNHRRVNFSNICVVELEAFGLYDNPRRLGPMSGYVSASSPFLKGGMPYHQDYVSNLEEETPDRFAGGRELSKAAEDLGRMALSSAELSDMDFLAINGEKIPVNSRIVSRRWGPYFDKLMGEALSALEGTDTATLRPSVVGSAQSSRNSSLTITSTLKNVGSDRGPGSDPADMNGTAVNPASRPRTLYLPHTPLTIQALLHFLYASALPTPTSHLCTPQILCSPASNRTALQDRRAP